MFFTESNSTLLTSKIYGGKISYNRRYTVYLRRNGKLLCGSTIIFFDIILTAPHCVYELIPPKYSGVQIVYAASMITTESSQSHSKNIFNMFSNEGTNIPGTRGKPKRNY